MIKSTTTGYGRGWVGLGAALVAGLAGSEARGLVDADEDGISDVWRHYYASEGLAGEDDGDGDGFSNWHESIAGTDPRDRHSKPAILSTRREPAAPWIEWQGKAATVYRVERAPGPGGPWQAEAERGSDWDGSLRHWFEPAPGGRSFFRVAVPDPPAGFGELDSDGDGQPDFVEIEAGSDPYEAGSLFAVAETGHGEVLRVEIQSVPGMSYQVQALRGASGGWVDEGPEVVATGERSVTWVENPEDVFLVRLIYGSADTDGDGVSDWEERLVGTDPAQARTFGGEAGDAAVVAARMAEPDRYELRAVRSTAMPLAGGEGLVEIRRTSGMGRARLALEIGGSAVAGSEFDALPVEISLPAEDPVARLPVRFLPGAPNGRTVTVTTADPALRDPIRPGLAEVRVMRPVTLSVAWFGATGDGVTDDTEAIQWAIDTLEADPFFNTLWFPAGKYRLASTTFSTETGTPTRRLLKLGAGDLSGRDLRLVGDPGAVLYSDTSPTRAHMLVAMASFRSLRVEGLTFEKSDTPLGPGGALGADGVSLVQVDERFVEDVTFEGCDFINCHGAVFTYGTGFDIRGHLRSLNFDGCRILNPWGTNTSGVNGVWGGGQQVAMGAWVGTASYRGCLFEGGGEDMSDPVRSPGGRLKDGCHFGSPMRLVFHDNEVRKMGVESVYQTNGANYMGTTAVPFTVPEADGSTEVMIPVRLDETTYLPGQIVSFRIPTTGTQLGRNTILRVTGWDEDGHVVTAVNDGQAGNDPPGTTLPSLLQIYLQVPPVGEVDIRRNRVDGTFPPGAERTNPYGIATDVRGVIEGNTILNCGTGVSTYREATVPLFPGARGLVIENNRILMRHPDDSPGPVTYGVQTHADDVLVRGNRIVCPLARRSAGIALRGKHSRVRDNHVAASEGLDNGYFSSDRAVGILVGNTSYLTAIEGNTTRRFDVGVGGEAGQSVPHSVTDHTSIEDVFPIDFRGLVEP